MAFLPWFRKTPATVQAMVVVPWDDKSSTAGLPSQFIFEHKQIIARLERKMADLESAATTGGGGSGGGGGVTAYGLFGPGCSGGGGGGLFSSCGSGGGGFFGAGLTTGGLFGSGGSGGGGNQ